MNQYKSQRNIKLIKKNKGRKEMLRSLKTYHNGPITRKETTLYNLMDEINQSFSINSIYVDKKENRGFVRTLKPLMHNKFNGKGKLSSLIEQVKDYENKTNNCKALNAIHRVALSSISNNSNQDRMLIDDEKKVVHKRLFTRERLDFYDELTNKTYRIKKFKEDEVTFTHSKILPEIQWQSVDNDVRTDDEQMKDAKDMLMDWLGDTIKLIKKDDKYLDDHILKKFKIKHQKKH